MATVSIPNSFVLATPADPAEVNENFETLADFVNTEVVHLDGSKAMGAAFDAGAFKIVNVASGVSTTDAVNKGQLDDVSASAVPTGGIIMWPTAVVPTNWLPCDGAAVSRTTYAALFAVIGVTYGPGNGSTTFNVPNFQNRFPVGIGPATWSDAVGETGGQTDAIIPIHGHTASSGNASVDHSHDSGSLSAVSGGAHQHSVTGLNVDGNGATGTTKQILSDAGFAFFGTAFLVSSNGAHSHTMSGSTGGQSVTHSHTVTVATATDGEAVTNKNLPPYMAVNFIIRTGV